MSGSGNIVGYANEQQRKDQRRAVENTFVVIDGTLCQVSNISLKGFLCVGYKGASKEGDEIIVEELLMANDSRIRINAQAIILRVDATTKEMVANFVDMSSKTFDTLEKMMMLRPVSDKGDRVT